MSINIKIDAFEGPMDLLLHLIKKAEVDIYDIPISEITEQYIGYLKKMEELDLNIASEFLVMAATLLEIKSQMLLPKKKTVDDKISADMDPRQELVEKLVEYKKYKEFAEKLKYIETDNFVYFKPPEIIEDIENVEIMFKNITLENLMHAFKKIVNTYENKFNKRSAIPRDIDFDEYRIEDKMSDIQRLLQKSKRVSFSCFFEGAENKLEIIVIFLAMLELIKLKHISVIQYNNFGDIVIEGQDDLWKTS
jgi:segregation and condensation protein A